MNLAMRKRHNTIGAAQLLHASQPVTIDRNHRSRSPEYAEYWARAHRSGRRHVKSASSRGSTRAAPSFASAAARTCG